MRPGLWPLASTVQGQLGGLPSESCAVIVQFAQAAFVPLLKVMLGVATGVVS